MWCRKYIKNMRVKMDRNKSQQKKGAKGIISLEK